MVDTLATAAGDEGFRAALIGTAYVLGLRHGIDWDHIAAIGDITAGQVDTRRSLALATLYALGHAAVVLLLGSIAILTGGLLSDRVDQVMERVVGVTLLVLAVYVVYGLARYRRDFRLRSRWGLLLGALRRLRRRRAVVVEIEHEHDHVAGHGHDHDGEERVGGRPRAAVATVTAHRHPHRHHGLRPEDAVDSYGRVGSTVIGMLHGIGAETASQVLIFLAAAEAGGLLAGEVVLVAFVLGLLTSNTGIAVASATGLISAERHFRVYASISVVTAVFSLGLGVLYLFGKASVLPGILAG